MQQTTNYKLNKPDGTDAVDVTKLNENMDTLDTEVKKIDDKVNNISVPVKSVNAKTGTVVLTSGDIKMADGTTVEAKVNSKADSFNKSDRVDLADSDMIATSKAVKTAWDLANSKQSSTDNSLITVSKKISGAINELLLSLHGFIARKTVFNSDGSITETGDTGVKLTTFNNDGTITEKFTDKNNKSISKKTTFNSDGSITEAII